MPETFQNTLDKLMIFSTMAQEVRVSLIQIVFKQKTPKIIL